MARYKMVALTNPVEGKEEAFNDWYQNVHLPEVVAQQEFVSGRRYRVKQPLLDPSGYRYVCVYEIETEDFGAFMNRMAARAQSGARTMSDAADRAGAYTVIFEECGAEVSHAQAVAMVGAG